MEDEQRRRVKYLNNNDFLLGSELSNAEAVLSELVSGRELTINDAIEYRQCKRLFDNGVVLRVWTPERHDDLLKLADQANSLALKALKQNIESNGFCFVFDNVERQYKDAFWELVEASGSEKHIDSCEIEATLVKDQTQLKKMLNHPKITKTFPDELKKAMVSHPIYAAGIIMDAIVVSHSSPQNIYLPSSLEEKDVIHMIDAFIDQDEPHLNYLDVITSWPSGLKYKMPGETILAAKRKYKEVANRLFVGKNQMKYGLEVVFSNEHKACAHVSFSGLIPKYSYSIEWIEKYHDSATLLNNFIHIFDFVDKYANLEMPAHSNDSRSILSRLTIRSKADYNTSIDFDISDMKARVIIRAYRDILMKLGIRLEDIISWFFNEYIEDEFKVNEFHIDMPSKGTTYLEKCKSLSSEIEKMLKTYALYVEKGVVDPELVPYRTFTGFDAVPSLIKQKYLRGIGNDFNRATYALFSDQSMLAYTEKYGSKYETLFGLLLREKVEIDDFPDWSQSDIQWLIDYGVISQDAVTRDLSLTQKTVTLHTLWDDGVIACHHIGKGDQRVIDELVSAEDSEYYSTLFSDDEANYMSFNFDNKKFGNARAIRNAYSHGGVVGNDPNDSVHHSNYVILLLLIVSVVLKINDEFCFIQQKVDMNEFIEWPYKEVDKASIPDEINKGVNISSDDNE